MKLRATVSSWRVVFSEVELLIAVVASIDPINNLKNRKDKTQELRRIPEVHETVKCLDVYKYKNGILQIFSKEFCNR